MMEPTISIIIPIYNMGSSIQKCVLSVLKQDSKDYEVILVDDGSNDNSLEECKKLKTIDSRIRVYHTENMGSGPARNFGISKVIGKYVYFMDADDYLHPEAVSSLIALVNKHTPDLVVFGFEKANQKTIILRTKNFENKEVDGSVARQDYSEFCDMSGQYTIQGAPWNKLFSLALINQYNIKFPSLRRHQDDAFIGRYMCFTNKIVFSELVLYTHYVNDLKIEWQKYPINYIDSVIGLYSCRKQTILTWNPNDKRTRSIIEKEYICNIIKALELSFSPKSGLDNKERRKWVAKAIADSKIEDINISVELRKYQLKIITLIKKKKYRYAIFLMNLKVFLEKVGVVSLIKKIL